MKGKDLKPGILIWDMGVWAEEGCQRGAGGGARPEGSPPRGEPSLRGARPEERWQERLSLLRPQRRAQPVAYLRSQLSRAGRVVGLKLWDVERGDCPEGARRALGPRTGNGRLYPGSGRR